MSLIIKYLICYIDTFNNIYLYQIYTIYIIDLLTYFYTKDIIHYLKIYNNNLKRKFNHY